MTVNPPAADTDTGSGSTQGKRMPTWAWVAIATGLILAAAVAFILALTSSADRGTPPVVSPTAAAETLESSAAASSEAAPTVLPECDTANVFAMTQLEGYDRGTKEVDSGDQRSGFGPAGNHALSNSVQSRGCDYPGPLTQLTAELSPEVMTKLRETVQEQGDTVESTHGIATAYTWTERPFGDETYNQTWSYVFIENIWIAMYLPSSEIESAVIDSAVEGALEANPTFRK